MFSELIENESFIQKLCVKIVKSYIMDKSGDMSDEQTTSLNDISDVECSSEFKKIKPRRRKPRKKRKLVYCSDIEWDSDEDSEQPPKKRLAIIDDQKNKEFGNLISFSDSETSTLRPMKNYQLRPRTFLRRPLAKRENLEEERASPEIFTRGRGRAAQLSKYRRRTANARERHRMKEINTAFATLRGVLPRPSRVKESTLTKITTLRMAVDYIRTLDRLLNDGELTPKSFCSTVAAISSESSNKMSSESPPVSFEQMVLEISSSSLSKCKGHNKCSSDTSPIDRFDKITDEYSFSYNSNNLTANEISNIEEDPIALLLSGDVGNNFRDIMSDD